jgi:hypothetical protein
VPKLFEELIHVSSPRNLYGAMNSKYHTALKQAEQDLKTQLQFVKELSGRQQADLTVTEFCNLIKIYSFTYNSFHGENSSNPLFNGGNVTFHSPSKPRE